MYSNEQTLRSSLEDSSSAGVTIKSGHAEADKFDRFEYWLRENGAEFSMLELREYVTKDSSCVSQVESDAAEEKKETGGKESTYSSSSSDEKGDETSEMRGVHARVMISPNTVCVAIPRKCLITVEMGQSTPIGQAVLNSDLDLDAPKHIFLMIYLLWDQKVNGDKSFFKPYYDILPKTLSNMPIFWSDEELSYLEGSYLLAQIADRNDAITDDYHAICEIAPELADIATLEEFKWARMCVCSRNFGLQIDGHRTSALVPHADMLNHYRPRETKWTFDDETHCFTITTLQSIPVGAQVYDSYGQKCNHRFLLNYGFAVEDNREIDGFCPNEVPLELGIMPDDPLYDAKQDFWTRGDGSSGSNAGVSALAAAVTAASTSRRQNIDPTAVVSTALETATSAASEASSHHSASGPPSRSRSLSGNSDESIPVIKRVRVCVSNNENTRILFSMLRVIACNESELRILSSSPSSPIGDGGCPGYVSRALLGLSSSGVGSSVSSSATFYRTCRDIRHPLGLRNERAAMEHLLDVISRALAMYPSTLAQDINDLADESSLPRFSNKRHAKIQVRGEKEALHHFAQWARTALEVMDVIDKEIASEKGFGKNEKEVSASSRAPGFDHVIHAMEEEESIGGHGSLHHTIVRYCADVLGALRREEIKNIRRSRISRGQDCNGASGFV
uniref:SET domain-containing protein n=1 Tax=Odontella aurita TaxID=265563 RepID=A0A7S4NAB7_9STRA|eukprot:CAMPEP_0113531414 /NCGR_PEP_ID=MMETSP0015_2-20120614/3484_1 /TAXON_ID=2838 /ORGANISM="Odontella" /LENGTH=675 /DNA_ID=CAMNT_0000430249 /DNA_START=48 /DNA_END=2075 /DNA_ORIENTATION=- /assembly_acc=CAM_ASM_000160